MATVDLQTGQKMLKVEIALPSGHCETLSVRQSSKIGALRILAQKLFGRGFLRLVTEGYSLTDPAESILDVGLQDGDSLTALVLEAKLVATQEAFALWCRGGGRVITWGCPYSGGDSSAVQERLRNVRDVQSTGFAFAATLENGSVVAWGHPDYGGDSSGVEDLLRSVQQVEATQQAFAAILSDGSVVTWGVASYGGDSSRVQHELRDVKRVQGTDYAFAAILADGFVVTWGDPRAGGDSSGAQVRLRNVRQVQATKGAFAAILADGSVVTWGDFDVGAFVPFGHPRWSSSVQEIQNRLRRVQQVSSTDSAFAAILVDGSVVT